MVDSWHRAHYPDGTVKLFKGAIGFGEYMVSESHGEGDDYLETDIVPTEEEIADYYKEHGNDD